MPFSLTAEFGVNLPGDRRYLNLVVKPVLQPFVGGCNLVATLAE
jgi:hypothetical protein